MLRGGHDAAILQLAWSRDSRYLYLSIYLHIRTTHTYFSMIFSCSADHSVGIWDVESGERVKKFRGHQGIVNSLSASKRGQEMICSVSDDGLIKVWDVRVKDAVKCFGDGAYPLLSTSFSRDGGIVYSAGITNTIDAWDLRKDAIAYSLEGHSDTITGILSLFSFSPIGLKLSPDGDKLLSNSMDNTGKRVLATNQSLYMGYSTFFYW
jgi:Prp8 binding protein